MERSDHQLLDSYASRQDPEAFRLLVQRYNGMVFGTARRVTSDAALAEDIAQEVFLELARQCDRLTGSLPAWLHRVAYNRALDANRRRATRKRYEAEAADHRHRLAGEAGWDELGPTIDAAIESLPEDLRHPLVQCYLLGRTQEDLAQELDVCATTVSRRIAKALKRLRTNLRKQGVAAGAAAVVAALGRAGAEAAPAHLAMNLSKIGLAGIGGGGAGSALTGVGAGAVAALVAVTVTVLGLAVGIAAWTVADPSPAAVTMAAAPVHPRLGPVVGYVEGDPVYAGDLLLPMGWPEAPPAALGEARTALPMLDAAARDQVLTRLRARDVATQASPESWRVLQQQRDALRQALVEVHGQGDVGEADRALRASRGLSLQEALRRQWSDVLARQWVDDHLTAVEVPAAESPETVTEPLTEQGAAENRTPSPRQLTLARLRGAAFHQQQPALDQRLLDAASSTPTDTMAQATWQWIAGTIPAGPRATPVLQRSAVMLQLDAALLSDAAWRLLDLPMTPPTTASELNDGDSDGAAVVFTQAAGVTGYCWLDDVALTRLWTVTRADPLAQRGNGIQLAGLGPVPSTVSWRVGASSPLRVTAMTETVSAAGGPGTMRTAIEFQTPPSWRTSLADGTKDGPVRFVLQASGAGRLLLDLGPIAPAPGENVPQRALLLVSVRPNPVDADADATASY